MSPLGLDRLGVIRPLKIRDFRLMWTGMTVSLIGADTTLILGGVLGALVTLVFLFVPGVRDLERQGDLQDSEG